MFKYTSQLLYKLFSNESPCFPGSHPVFLSASDWQLESSQPENLPLLYLPSFCSLLLLHNIKKKQLHRNVTSEMLSPPLDI